MVSVRDSRPLGVKQESTNYDVAASEPLYPLRSIIDAVSVWSKQKRERMCRNFLNAIRCTLYATTTASIGDYFGFSLIFGAGCCIIVNKMNTEYKIQETDGQMINDELKMVNPELIGVHPVR
jgi:hypothetical protein